MIQKNITMDAKSPLRGVGGLIGPFTQLLTMDNLPERGKLSDEQLEIIPDAGILHQ